MVAPGEQPLVARAWAHARRSIVGCLASEEERRWPGRGRLYDHDAWAESRTNDSVEQRAVGAVDVYLENVKVDRSSAGFQGGREHLWAQLAQHGHQGRLGFAHGPIDIKAQARGPNELRVHIRSADGHKEGHYTHGNVGGGKRSKCLELIFPALLLRERPACVPTRVELGTTQFLVAVSRLASTPGPVAHTVLESIAGLLCALPGLARRRERCNSEAERREQHCQQPYVETLSFNLGMQTQTSV